MTGEARAEPSRSSYYVDEAFYRSLIAAFEDWRRDDREIPEADRRDEFRRLLEHEARLLDEARLEEWLALFAPECVYWMPGTVAKGDPRREIAIAFDDRRRMEDRIYRLRTGIAWSQVPASRTVRLVSNIQGWRTDDAAVAMVRANFIISEFRDAETRTWSGWTAHRLRRRGGRWEILVKQINLIDRDQNLRNPSIIF